MSTQKSKSLQKVEGVVEDYGKAESALLSWGIRHEGEIAACGGYEESRTKPYATAEVGDIYAEIEGNSDQTASYSVDIPEQIDGEEVRELLEILGEDKTL